MLLVSGSRLGPYEVLAPVGAGGMGEVYQARDTRLDRMVAIKVLAARLAGREDLRKRFEREARLISSLNHPHICIFYDVGHQDGTDYLVMEYVEGATLAQRLQSGPFCWDGEKEDNIDIYVKLVGAGAPLRLTSHPVPDFSPVWSPDGRYIAFFRQLPEKDVIYVVPSLGGPERKVGEKSTHEPWWNMDWSPDGKSLAFSDKSSPEEPFSIFLLSIETGERRQLTRAPEGSIGHGDLAFSPDGKSLVFVQARGVGIDDLYLIDVAGGEPKRLTFETTRMGDPVWTANGREIVFTSTLGGSGHSLWKVSASGGRPERLPAVGPGVLDPAISHQGNRLAYTQSLHNENIWRLEVTASTDQRKAPTRLISSTLNDSDPGYSPDGTKIVFTSRRSGSSEIWVCDSDGSHAIQLTNMDSPQLGTARWSPDGRQIAFDSRPGGSNADIYVISVDGGKPRRLTTDPVDDIAPSWSRDGRWIYFGSMRSGTMQIWKMPAAGGKAVQATQHGGLEGFESVDGQWFYYAKGHNRIGDEIPGIWKVPVEGGEESLILDVRKAGSRRFWTVVGQGIYFVTAERPARPVIEFFSFATGKVTQVATLEKPIPRYSTGLTVSPEGRWILYTQVDQSGSDIMLVENFR